MSHLSTYGYNEQTLQKAIIFLSTKFAESGNNPKPVVMHSIRVAEMLWTRGASEAVVMAAFLHDVLEDTSVTYKELASEFGNTIADIVKSLTHEKTGDYNEKLEHAIDSYQRSHDLSLDSLMIRACDLVDNSYYFHEAADENQRRYLHAKYTYFMNLAEARLASTDYWVILQDAYLKNVSSLVNLAQANAKN